MYGLNRYGNSLSPSSESPLNSFIDISNAAKGKAYRGLSSDAVSKFSTDRINLSAGSIVKRISMTKETKINAGGFFAAYKPADVDRYKAVLPIYWKQWGSPQKDGFVVNLQAMTDVKAPSPRETFDMFQEFISSSGPKGETRRSSIQELISLIPGAPTPGTKVSDESFARQAFPAFSVLWNEEGSKLPVVSSFLDSVKGRGFNAIVDMNDAGSLAETPMRFLDGYLFNVAGHEVLSADNIRAAQEAIVNLAQSGMLVLDEDLYSQLVNSCVIEEEVFVYDH